MFTRSCLLVLLVLCSSAAFAESFATLELTPLSVPAGFEHAKRFRIAYFNTVDGQRVPATPTYRQKLEDLDLIEAHIVRSLIVTEYEAVGRYIDDSEVVAATAEQIRELVANPSFVTAAWADAGREQLAEFLRTQSDSLRTFFFNVITDYSGGSESDTNPLLIRLQPDGSKTPDDVTVIFVTRELERF